MTENPSIRIACGPSTFSTSSTSRNRSSLEQHVYTQNTSVIGRVHTLSVGSISYPAPISIPGEIMLLLGGNADRFEVATKSVPFRRYSLSSRAKPVTSSDPGTVVSTWVDADTQGGRWGPGSRALWAQDGSAPSGRRCACGDGYADFQDGLYEKSHRSSNAAAARTRCRRRDMTGRLDGRWE